MKRARWIWILPLVQLVLALACHIYDPHLYRVMPRSGVLGSVEQSAQNFPTPVGRTSRGVNFPALVLAYPLRNWTDPVYERNSPYTLIWIDPHDVGFFAGVVLFWFWAGRALDQFLRQAPRRSWPRGASLAGLTCGLVFGGLTGAYALQMITSQWRPERQIGAFGMVWAGVLLIYFTWRLRRGLASRVGKTAGVI
jgi:hypothetical protein